LDLPAEHEKVGNLKALEVGFRRRRGERDSGVLLDRLPRGRGRGRGVERSGRARIRGHGTGRERARGLGRGGVAGLRDERHVRRRDDEGARRDEGDLPASDRRCARRAEGCERNEPGRARAVELLIELLAQHRVGARQLRTDRPRRDSALGRDLGRLQVLVVAQENDGPVRFRQPEHGLDDAVLEHHPLARDLFRLVELRPRGGTLARVAAALGPRRIPRAAGRHPREPDPQGARGPGRSSQGLQPSLLNEILRGVLVARQAPRERPDESAVLQKGFGRDRKGLGGHGGILRGTLGLHQEDTAQEAAVARKSGERGP
jgi:hypothetical protein